MAPVREVRSASLTTSVSQWALRSCGPRGAVARRRDVKCFSRQGEASAIVPAVSNADPDASAGTDEHQPARSVREPYRSIYHEDSLFCRSRPPGPVGRERGFRLAQPCSAVRAFRQQRRQPVRPSRPEGFRQDLRKVTMIGTMLVAFIALVITLYVGVAVAPVLDGRDYSAFRHAG